MDNFDNIDKLKTRKDLSDYRLERAAECLNSAKLLLDAGDYLSAANRSYYCIFHSVRSLLALEGVEFKRHSGNLSYFREKYIKTNIFDKELSDIMTAAFNIRSDSDYGDFPIISKAIVHNQISNAERFYDTVKGYIDNLGDTK